MRDLEKHIVESNEASFSNTSLADMLQTMMQLMNQIDEKGFELEIRSADNRILQEELQNKDSLLPADALPIALLPGYIFDSDPEEDDEEDQRRILLTILPMEETMMIMSHLVMTTIIMML
ncbi:kinesin-like protein KIN-7D, mitochondrial [Tanacetum coccineum]|uniref:Kinesin-like protein KIN-7D, mitochondrial n=1 Tax=Tanacetum coccineum TaxID=301880 RepID=A0ABQ5BJQ2_9ASTR